MAIEDIVKKIEAQFPDKYDLYPDSIKVPICNNCKHLIEGTAACKAFPGRIPEDILDGSFDHKTNIPGDDGIKFEPKS